MIMKHQSIRTFLKHYLPRRIDADMVGIMLGREVNGAFMRAVTRMSRWANGRRPLYLTTSEQQSIEEDPEVQSAKKERDKAEQMAGTSTVSHPKVCTCHVCKAKKNLINTKKRRLYALKKEVRTDWDDKEAMEDIDRYLSGLPIDDDGEGDMVIGDEMPSQQADLLAKLTSLPESRSIKSELRRRCIAIDSVRNYCSVDEGGPCRGCKPKPVYRSASQVTLDRRARVTVATTIEAREAERLEAARDHIEHADKPLACFQCFGEETKPVGKRTQRWKQTSGLNRHFRDYHLSPYVDDNKPVHCNYCKVMLDNKMHFQRHASDIHRVL